MTVEPPPEAAATRLIALLCIGAMLLTQLPWMAATNFTGFDEWLIVDLVSKGIIDVPHGNRPVHLLWLLPAALVPYSLTPYVVLHGVYSFLSGALVFFLCRLVAPGRPLLWLLTAIVSVTWGPADLARLSTIERAGYTAFEFGTLLAIFLFVESWRMKSISVLAFGSLVAFLVARSYEAVVPLLICGPFAVLVLWLGSGRPPNRLRTWLLVWEGVLLLAIVLVILPLLFPTDLMAYQLRVLGLDLVPSHVALRLGRQFLYHLAPLILSSPLELATVAVPIAVLVFVLAGVVWARVVGRGREGASGRSERHFHLRSMVAGLTWAVLAYSVLTLTPSQPSALRMQVLSAPGIALFLSSFVLFVATLVPPRMWRASVGLMGAWIVAVGTGRTVAMQKTWDGASAYPAQVHMLRELTRRVPDVKAGTLILLLDQGRAWRATYGFRHAVRYLYEGRASGYIAGAWDALYPAVFTSEGIRVEPWPALRQAWGIRVTLNRYSDIIAVRHASDGRVEVLEQWPDELPPLPPGARYEPDSRIVTRGSPLPERAILGAAPQAP